MKRLLSLLGRFLLCNLVAWALGSLAESCLVYPLHILIGSVTVANLINELTYLLLILVPMYWLMFRWNGSFVAFCKEVPADLRNPRHMTVSYLKREWWQALAVLLLSMTIVTVIPGRILTEHGGGDTGVTLLFASSGVFTSFLPTQVLGGDGLLPRLIGAVLWGACILAFYCLLLSLACRRYLLGDFDKGIPQLPRLLLVVGMVLELFYFLHECIYTMEVHTQGMEENSAWFTMMMSLVIVVFAEIAYALEAVWAVVRDRDVFSALRLLAIVVSMLVLSYCAYHGGIRGIIADVYMVALLGLQVFAFIRYGRVDPEEDL